MTEDTIAAIATPLGEGGLAVIRLSGAQALSIADRCFGPSGRAAPLPSASPTHTVHHGHVRRDGQTIDEVLLTVMRAPRTYTREDVVEISCHGGPVVAKQVLDAVLACGARLALPGEFTKRAFLSGRIDLTQAEAVADLIHAQTDLAARAAAEQLAGHLSKRINRLRDDLMHVLAHVEAHIDFPDEDIAPDTHQQLLSKLESGLRFMDDLLRTAPEGRVLRRGIRAAILGQPNVGKSSLLNRLLGHDRAIVSAVPGTTRDTIEETANVRGIPVVFVDTAGLRDAADEVEAEGVRRSEEALARAELVLHVLDASAPLAAGDVARMRELAGREHITVLNKCDLPSRLKLPPTLKARVVRLSCLTGEGMDLLRDMIRDRVWSGSAGTGMLEVMINSRHEDALNRARTAVEHTLESFRTGQPLDLVAVDLHIAVSAVGEIVGQTTTEDLLDAIFSQFCIGK